MKTKIHLLMLVSAIIIIIGASYEQTKNVTSAPVKTASDELPSPVVTIKDGASMVLIPEGEFLMGSSDEQIEKMSRIKPDMPEHMRHETPQHRVYLDDFYIDQHEVTNAQFQKFVEETNYVTDAEREGWGYCWEGTPTWPQIAGVNWRSPFRKGDSIAGKSDHPVIQVSYNDALAYARWAGKRLPTEAEWEKAARGTDGRMYPWGDAWDANNVNSREGGPRSTLPVGSRPGGASPYGAHDMGGNVWEWVADWYHPRFYLWTPYRNPTGIAVGEHRVLRGGSWLNTREWVRCAHRDNYVTIPSFRIHRGGFRCALDADDIDVGVQKQNKRAWLWGKLK